MNITAGVAKQPFADKQRSFTLKDSDQSLPISFYSNSSSYLKRKNSTFERENSSSISPPKATKLTLQ